jgi:hypothetical protein
MVSPLILAFRFHLLDFAPWTSVSSRPSLGSNLRGTRLGLASTDLASRPWCKRLQSLVRPLIIPLRVRAGSGVIIVSSALESLDGSLSHLNGPGRARRNRRQNSATRIGPRGSLSQARAHHPRNIAGNAAQPRHRGVGRHLADHSARSANSAVGLGRLVHRDGHLDARPG